MKFGIVLLAIGLPDYGKLALNMAISIRHFSGDLPIQLIHDSTSISGIKDNLPSIFDVITEIDEKDCRLNGKVYPAKAKLSLFKYAAFDRNLYLDVDGVAIKDLRPFFEAERKFYESEVQGWGDLTIHDYGLKMQWSNGSVISEHYGLPTSTMMPFINSSAQYFDKSKESELLFQCALDNLNNPIPAKELYKGWGKKLEHRQPDELYMNIALAQRGVDPTCSDKLVYFHLRNEPGLPMAQVKSDYYVLGCYGSLGTNHRRIYEVYDTTMRIAMKSVLGQSHVFKIDNLMTSKFMVYEPN